MASVEACVHIISMVRSVLSLAIFMASAPMIAAEVELVLIDGQRMRGEVTSENERTISITLVSLSHGEVKRSPATIPLERIAKRVALRPAMEEYEERRKALDGSPEACFKLAQWCAERALVEQAAAQAKEGLAMDSESAWGGRVMDQIGWIKINGRWVAGSEHAAATGTVRWGDGFVSATEADVRRRLATATRERDAARAAATELEGLAKADPKSVEQTAKALESAQKAKENAAKAFDAADNAMREGMADAKKRAGLVERRQAAAARNNEAEAAVAKAKREAATARTRAAGAKDAEEKLAPAKDRLAKAEAAVAELSRQVPTVVVSATGAKRR